MRRITLRIALLVLIVGVVGSTADAQRRVRRRPAAAAGVLPQPSFGPRLGYDFKADHWFLGGQVNLPVARRLAVAPSAEFYLGSTGTPYRLNADLKYHPPTVYGLFYFGGGLAILHSSGGTDTGANLFGGWEGQQARPFKPFVEAKLVFSSGTSFNIQGGINFPI